MEIILENVLMNVNVHIVEIYIQEKAMSYIISKIIVKKSKEIEEQKQAIFTKLKEDKEKEDDRIKNLEKENKEIKKVVYELEKKLEKKFKTELKKTKNISNNSSNIDNSINNTDNSVSNSNNNNNNNTILNNQQNIVLVDYNKEDLSKIDKKEIFGNLKKRFPSTC